MFESRRGQTIFLSRAHNHLPKLRQNANKFDDKDETLLLSQVKEVDCKFFSINIPFSEIAIYLHDFTFGLTIFFSLDFLKFSDPL